MCLFLNTFMRMHESYTSLNDNKQHYVSMPFYSVYNESYNNVYKMLCILYIITICLCHVQLNKKVNLVSKKRKKKSKLILLNFNNKINSNNILNYLIEAYWVVRHNFH